MGRGRGLNKDQVLTKLRSSNRADKLDALRQASSVSESELQAFFSSLSADEQKFFKSEFDKIDKATASNSKIISHTHSIEAPASYNLGRAFEMLKQEANGIEVEYKITKSGRRLFQKENIVYTFKGDARLVELAIQRMNSAIREYES